MKRLHDVFISYHSGEDEEIAVALEGALQRMAKPFYRLKAVDVFRDRSDLIPTPDLWEKLREALDRSKFLLLLASPDSANSPWVQQELEYWLETRSIDHVIFVRTSGKISGSPGGAIDWDSTDALGEDTFRKVLRRVPLFIPCDMRTEAELSLSNPAFREVVAKISATVHGLEPRDILDEDYRQHRRTRWVTRLAISLLMLLTLTSGAGFFRAIEGQQQAVDSRERTETFARKALEKAKEAYAAKEEESVAREEESAAKERESIQRQAAEEATLEAQEQSRIASLREYEARQAEALARREEEKARQAGLQLQGANQELLTNTVLDNYRVGRQLLLRGNHQLALEHFSKAKNLNWEIESPPELPALGGMMWLADRYRSETFRQGDNLHFSESGDLFLFRDALYQLVVQTTHGERLVTLQGGSFYYVSEAVFQPQAGLVGALVDRKDHVAIWSLETGELLHRLRQSKSLDTFDISFDGRYAVTGNEEEMILWDLEQEVAKRTFSNEGRFPGVEKLLLSPDASKLLTRHPSTTTLWDTRSGSRIQEWEHWGGWNDRESGHRSEHFSPDGARLVLAGLGVDVELWTERGTGSSAVLQGHRAAVHHAIFSPDGKHLLTAGEDRVVMLWNAWTGELLHTLLAHERSILGGNFSRDGQRFLTYDRESINLWETTTGALLDSFIEGDSLSRACLNSEGERVLMVLDEQYSPGKLWTVYGGNELNLPPMESMSFSRDGRILQVVSRDDEVSVWDLESGDSLLHLGVGEVEMSIDQALLDPLGDSLLVLDNVRSSLKLWRIGAEVPKILSEDQGMIADIVFHPEGSFVGAIFDDGRIVLWDKDSGIPKFELFAGGTGRDSQLYFVPGRGGLVSSGRKRIQSWDLQDGRGTLQYTVETGASMQKAILSPDGATIALNTFGKLRLWGATDGALLRDGPGAAQRVAGPGKPIWGNKSTVLLTTTGYEPLESLTVWDIPTLKPERRFDVGGFTAFALSPDDQFIVFSDTDSSLTVWEVATGEQVGVLGRHPGGAHSLVFRPPDGNQLFSIGRDGRNLVWDWPFSRSRFRYYEPKSILEALRDFEPTRDLLDRDEFRKELQGMLTQQRVMLNQQVLDTAELNYWRSRVWKLGSVEDESAEQIHQNLLELLDTLDVPILDRVERTRLEIRSHSALARIVYERGQVEVALEHMHRALEKLSTLRPESLSMEPVFWLLSKPSFQSSLAEDLRQIPKVASFLITSLRNLGHEINYHDLFTLLSPEGERVEEEIAFYSQRAAADPDPESAIADYQHALLEAERFFREPMTSKHLKKLFELRRSLARVLGQNKDWTEALEQYRLAEILIERLSKGKAPENPSEFCSLRLEKVDALIHLEDFPEVLAVLKELGETSEDRACDSPQRQAELYGRVAKALADEEEFGLALEARKRQLTWLDLSEHEFEGLERELHFCVAEGAQARLYLKLGDLESSSRFLQAALTTCHRLPRTPEDYPDFIESYLYSDTWLNRARTAYAQLLQVSKELFGRQREVRGRERIAGKLARLYVDIGKLQLEYIDRSLLFYELVSFLIELESLGIQLKQSPETYSWIRQWTSEAYLAEAFRMKNEGDSEEAIDSFADLYNAQCLQRRMNSEEASDCLLIASQLVSLLKVGRFWDFDKICANATRFTKKALPHDLEPDDRWYHTEFALRFFNACGNSSPTLWDRSSLFSDTFDLDEFLEKYLEVLQAAEALWREVDRGDLSDEDEDFREALVEAYRTLSRRLPRLEEVGMARNLAEKGLRLSDGDLGFYQNLILIFLFEGDIERAHVLYRQLKDQKVDGGLPFGTDLILDLTLMHVFPEDLTPRVREGIDLLLNEGD